MAQRPLFPQGMFPNATFNPITGAQQARNFGTGASFSPWAFASGLVNPQPFGGPMDPNTAAKAEIAALRPALNKDLLQAAHTGGSGGFKFDDSSSPAAEIYGQLGQEANEAANAIQAKYGLEAWKIEQENKKDAEDKKWSILSSLLGSMGGGGGGGVSGGGGGGGVSGGGGGGSEAAILAEIAGLKGKTYGGAEYNPLSAQEDELLKREMLLSRGPGPQVAWHTMTPEQQAELRKTLEAQAAELTPQEQLRLDKARLGRSRGAYAQTQSSNAARASDVSRLKALEAQLQAIRRGNMAASTSTKDPYQERIWKYIEQLMRGV